MNHQILEEHLWINDKYSVLTRIPLSSDKQFKVTPRIVCNRTEYLNLLICSSKNEAIRCFDLVSEYAERIGN